MEKFYMFDIFCADKNTRWTRIWHSVHFEEKLDHVIKHLVKRSEILHAAYHKRPMRQLKTFRWKMGGDKDEIVVQVYWK